MEQKNTQAFLLEAVFDWLIAKAKQYCVPLLTSLIFGMLAHGFTFTNKLLNHDETCNLFGKGGTYTLGRWGLELCEKIFPNFSMPWIYGILTVLLISIAVCVMVSILKIENKLLQGLLAGIIISFPSLTSTLTYMFTSASYALAMFLAVLSVWLIQRPTKYTVLPALGCMVLSLSIYQAYVSLAAGLLILLLIRELLLGEDLKKVLCRGVLFVAFLLVSMVLYLAANQLIMLWKGAHFSDYAEGSVAFSLAELPQRMGLAYDYFYRFLHWNNLALVPSNYSTILHGHLLKLIPVLFILCCMLRKVCHPIRILFLLALIGLLPLACNAMYLITPEMAVHSLMVYSFVCLYILTVILADLGLSQISAKKLLNLLQRLAVDVTAVILALVLATNVYFANEVALYQHVQYENLYSFYTALTADIMQMPEFDENTRLAVIGEYNPAFENFPPFFIEVTTGANTVEPAMYSNYWFMRYYIGFPIEFLDPNEAAAIQTSPEFKQMPTYPYTGSMRFLGDTLVVKLS